MGTALVLCAADAPANFSGKWILDNKKIDAAPIPITNLGAGGGSADMGGGMGGEFPGAKSKTQQPPAAPAPMIIEQTETEIHITNTFNRTPYTENYKLDGKEIVKTAPPMPNTKEEGEEKD